MAFLSEFYQGILLSALTPEDSPRLVSASPFGKSALLLEGSKFLSAQAGLWVQAGLWALVGL
jgi:hypothetical protein